MWWKWEVRLAEVRAFNRTTNWVTAYIVVASIGLTMIGLVMLFSAGAVRGAQDLLVKQVVWVLISLIVGGYVSFVDLDWLRNRTYIIFALCLLGLVLTLVPGIGVKVNGAQILMLGITFKENCPDVRNTKVVDVISALKEYSVNVLIYDPWADEDGKRRIFFRPLLLERL